MSKTINMREIARICNVSPATVSRAINSAASVNTETRRKIENAIREHGYELQRKTPSKKRERCKTVGVFLPSVTHPFFQSVLLELDALLEKQGSYMVIFPERLPEALARIRQIPLDGMILLCEETDGDTIEQLWQLNLSVVMCGALSLSKSCPAVHVDDLGAAYEGTNYLLNLGHRKIGFLTDSPSSISSGFQRIAGSQKAMEDYGVAWEPRHVFSQACDFAGGYEGTKQILQRSRDITAIFAHSDDAAMGAITALTDLGLRVPDDISVLGFDNTGLSTRIRPRLTCVHQPIHDIAEKSLELLYADMEHPGRHSSPSITLPHSIKVRDSCKALFENNDCSQEAEV